MCVDGAKQHQRAGQQGKPEFSDDLRLAATALPAQRNRYFPVSIVQSTAGCIGPISGRVVLITLLRMICN